ncbi:MAG: asparagine synthase (glutamine-hydrolyzing) [Nitrospirae bacterium]|nr:MAG: asparagine synthase (glutamine-hydrolyzing) [Nitrospirota bacterium]
MCGICGIVRAEPPVRQIELELMADRLAHRGPDDAGYYVKNGVGLGHRRLSIIDLQTGHQPVSNEDGRIWVILNGEIYNYRELREQLVRQGHTFTTQTDTEVLVHLYEEYGTECPKYLRGMFAFALWDERTQQLFAARDRLGQKPFFYAVGPFGLLFASEIKGVLAVDPSLAEMDLAALDHYLRLRIIAPPRSMFRAIRKLPPAHYLTYSNTKGLHIERYWDLQYEPKLNGSDDDLLDELEARLIDCLKLHMVSDVPVGAFLSGGLDSTLVVSMLMRHVATEPLKTFSMGLPFGRYDEAPYARLVAKQYGTDHHEDTLVPSLIHTLPTLVWHLDEPSDPLSVCSYLIAQMASREVKVVLGGDGGDELFGGYDRYYGNRYASYYARLPFVVRRYLLAPLLERIPDGNWYKSLGHQIKWLHRLSFLEGGERYVQSLGYFYFSPSFCDELYGPTMQAVRQEFDAGMAIREAFAHAPASDLVDKMLYADSQIRLPDHSVMILDRMTMAHGLEARSPFMDHELAEFAARLPVRLKVRGRSLRYIQMRLAERYLPQPLLERPKQGFSSALPHLLRDEYRLLFQIFLQDSHLVRAGYFAQSTIDRLVNAHLQGTADHGNRLWLLLNSEVWYRMFIEGMSVEKLNAEIASRVDTNRCFSQVPHSCSQGISRHKSTIL